MPLRSGVSITRGVADLHRQEALVVVEGVDHEDVALEGVLPERAARAEREEAALPGEHHLAQLGVGDVLVADEGDAPHGDRLVLDDRELDDDLVVLLRRRPRTTTSARK